MDVYNHMRCQLADKRQLEVRSSSPAHITTDESNPAESCLPTKSSSGAGVVSAALSGTDRAGTKRGIKCIGAEPDKHSCDPKPARIKRGRRDVYLPRRNSAADRERDQELLSEIPLGLPAEEVA